MKNNMKVAIFYGVLWGFIEASLGGLLHFILFPYTGQIMGSVAFVILLRAMRKGVPVSSVFIIASIAAAIKLVDLYIFPGNPGAVLKPAMAILSQGLAFALVSSMVFLPALNKRRLLGGLLVTGWLALGISHLSAALLLEPLHELQHIYQAVFINVPLMMLAVFAVDKLFASKKVVSSASLGWQWPSLLLFLAFACKYLFYYAIV